MSIPESASPIPRMEEADAPPSALLDAAFRTFAAKGYRGTRLEEIADAVGMTKGAIYYYFSGKEDLLRRAVEAQHRAIFEEIEHALAVQGASVSVKIRFVLRKIWMHWLEPGWGHAFRLMVGEMSLEFPGLFRAWAREGPLKGSLLVRQLIEEGVRQGEFRRDVDAEVSARMVVSGLMLQAAQHALLGLDEPGPCDLDRIFDSAVELFLHGLTVVHCLPGERTGAEGV